MSKPAKCGTLLLALAVLVLCSAAAYVVRRHSSAAVSSADTLLLLVPDTVNASDADVQVWLDAASEEGLHMEVIHDSDLLRPTADLHGAGIVIPDQVHRAANDALIGALYRYVKQGGKLMLVYDAATWDLQGRFVSGESRLTNLTGVHYALYDNYGVDTMALSQVWGTSAAMHDLGIPPGKFVPLNHRREPGKWRPVALSDTDAQTRFAFSRYRFGDLRYPSFRTSGDYDGKVLLESNCGLVAGYRKYGSGGVLFVNLPLGYLTNRTDGLLLHAFLHYFAVKLLGLPYLASVPDGVGGLVLNWHIDARSALDPMRTMQQLGFFSQGPFSEHITAGPDVERIHDRRGLDVEHDAEIQQWIRFFVQRGDAIGSHGGWIHNYFGEHVNETNEEKFRAYLELNQCALERASGEQIREYSAPLGNQPGWVTKWLEHHGFVAYYFAGDSGMGPTQVYRDGVRDGPGIWAFPILHMGKEASLEEMQVAGLPEAEVREWLWRVADYTSEEHVARLIYSHPLGSTRFIHALAAWFAHTAELARAGRFHWYTMTQLGDFLNSRKQARWTMENSFSGKFTVEAAHPTTLVHLTWLFPQSRFERPAVVSGAASIREADGNWLVTASDCKLLKISTEETQRHSLRKQ